MAKLSDRMVEILSDGSKKSGYKLRHDRGEAGAVQSALNKEHIEEKTGSNGEAYLTTDTGKQALREHKAALKKAAA